VKNKFTPGPWYLSMHGGEHSQGIYSESRSRDIALVYNDCDKDEDQANADLLACAPELLEALERLLEEVCYVEVDTGIGPLPEKSEAYLHAERIIRKAKEGDR